MLSHEGVSKHETGLTMRQFLTQTLRDQESSVLPLIDLAQRNSELDRHYMDIYARLQKAAAPPPPRGPKGSTPVTPRFD
jgi:hypothetical protein